MMKKLIGLLSSLAVLVVLALTVLLVGARFIGLTPYSVLSGSMEPTYSAGDLLYVRKIAPGEIEIGMPITYVANEHLVVATHRVVDIHTRTTTLEPVVDSSGNPALDRNGQPIMQEILLEQPVYYYQTRGDANDAEDALPVYEKNVIGTPVYCIPYLGHFVTMLQTDAGKVMAVCFGLVIVILMFLPEMLQMFEKTDKKNEADAEEQDKEDDEAQKDEDILICDKKDGDDLVLEAKNADAGEDRLIEAKNAEKGEDVLIDDREGVQENAENEQVNRAMPDEEKTQQARAENEKKIGQED